MNQSIFYFFYNFSHQSKIFDYLSVFFAKYLPFLLIIILLYLFFKKSDTFKNKKIVLLSIFSGAVSYFFVKGIIVLFYPQPRPYILLSSVIPLITQNINEAYHSFPSGHTIFFFTISTVVYLYYKKLGTFFFFISFIMALSRIIIGVHWPIDIAFGGMLGIITGYIIHLIYNKYYKKFDLLIDPFLKMFL